MSPELSAAICVGLLSLAGVIIAAIIKGKDPEMDSCEREESVCLQHSGVVTSLARLEKDVAEMKSDIKMVDKKISKLVDNIISEDK